MENNVSIVKAEETQMSVFGSSANFETAQRMAKALCSSTIVPTAFQGQNNMANCIIALDIANRLGSNPLMIMQNLYVVHGMPAFSVLMIRNVPCFPYSCLLFISNETFLLFICKNNI